MVTIRPGPAVGAFAVLAVPLAVGAALAVWALASSPLQSSADPQPVVAQVQAAQRDNRTSTTVTLSPAPTVEVRSQSAGTVTGSALQEARPLRTGDVAYEVDGRPVIAYVAAAPLYRDITPGLQGKDVATAQDLLVETGHLKATDRSSTDAMRRAVRAFNAAHGSGTDVTTLAAGSLLWVPEGSGAPDVVIVRVGDVVQPQTPLYETARGASTASVAAPAAEVERSLTVGAVTVPLPAGSTVVTDPDDVADLAEVLGDQESGPAVLADVAPTKVGTVPASAVIVDEKGVSCYFRGLEADPVRIDATAGGFGLVDVDAALVGTPVLVNPRGVVDDLSCDS